MQKKNILKIKMKKTNNKKIISKDKKEITKASSEQVQASSAKIDKRMTFAELLKKKPESMNILFEAGLHCIGCHMSAFETIEQGCMAHGMRKKDIDELIKRLNK